MNGAQALIRTLVACHVDTCFTNPGTSEMHFVAALDSVPEMRGVLALFEGVATGAADGYARMAGRPASTLLHLGPGLGNGIANLHNARRARTPVVNIVGDHATYHRRFDAPLQSDIESLARNVSGWFRRTERTDRLGDDAAEAVAAALGPPGQVATLVLPADVSWSEGGHVAGPVGVAARDRVTDETVATVAKALRSGVPSAVLVGGSATARPALVAARRVADTAGAKLLCETFPARLERGAGVPAVERLAYLGELAAAQLDGLAHLVMVDATPPASFFAYPDRPSDLVPEGCEVHVLAARGDDALGALEHLADVLDAPGSVAVQPSERPELPTGALTMANVGDVIGALLPEGAIVSDEGNTGGLFVAPATAGAPPHDWLCLTGGSIGQGLPLAAGAALACPERKVVCLEADGSAMYTLQALWTQAREQLDVTTVILNNGSYAVLNFELHRVGAQVSGPKAEALLDLGNPDLDFVALAKGMGVPASRAETAEELTECFIAAIREPGPALIEAVVPARL